VGDRTTAATRVSESVDSAAMLDLDYALLPARSYDIRKNSTGVFNNSIRFQGSVVMIL
jgi:hypothetical protein